jgi:hypothetical protein
MKPLVLVLDISLSRRLTLTESIFVEASEETSSQSVIILHSVVVSYRGFDTIYRPIFNCQAVEEEWCRQETTILRCVKSKKGAPHLHRGRACNHTPSAEISMYRSHSNKNRKNYIILRIAKQIHRHDINLDFSPHHILHAPSYVLLSHKFLGIRRFFGCRTNQAWTASFTSSWDLKWRLLPHGASFRGQKKLISLGAKSGEYGGRCITSKFRIDLESLSRYDGLYEFRALPWCIHTPEDNKTWRFLRIASLSWFRSISLCLSLLINVILSKADAYFELYTTFRFSFAGPLYLLGLTYW